MTPDTPSSNRSAISDCPYVVPQVNDLPPVETAVSAIAPSTQPLCGLIALRLKESKNIEPLVEVATRLIGICIRSEVAFSCGLNLKELVPQLFSKFFDDEELEVRIVPFLSMDSTLIR